MGLDWQKRPTLHYQGSPGMIDRVIITNFKSIGEPGLDLQLKPLTLLVGPNGGGKSSILEAIAVASQQNHSGKLTNFPDWQSVIHKPDGSGVTIDIYFTPYDNQSSGGFRSTFGAFGGFNTQYLTENESAREISRRLMSELMENTSLIPSVRGNVPYSADTGGNPDWVGLQGQDLLPLLGIVFGRRLYENIENKIAKWASRFGVGGLKAGLLGGNRSGADYRDDKLEAVLALALASSGARQILTVITQLFLADEGSLVMIEEPEISLHPQAQVDVLEMFGEAIKEHKQIMATTHSLFLMQSLGYAVRKRWLAADQIAVYHVKKGQAGTTAAPLLLDENGDIEGWIPSFTDVERRLLLEWADSLPRA
jgi:energy-coupling factor transporter ATP-binding protein EcfA2